MIRLKKPEEIEILKESGKRLSLILKKLSAMVRPGVSTLELEEETLRLVSEGGDKPAFLGYKPEGARRPFPAALCVSINQEIVHGIPNESEKIIKEGDIVSLDMGVCHKGLITDAAITVPAGQVDDESLRLISTARNALMRGIEAAQPGKTIGDIGAAISKVVQDSGFSLAEDLVGHGVGYKVHEDPFVPNVGIEGKGEKLVPCLVIAIEPMVNAGKSGIKILSDGYTIETRDGSRSAHFEHTIVITEKGNIILTL
ncbi:MAG: type I methionyl aminopeptidase [Candidatus Zambryskibacteria bacterium CG_4_9_14_3_um_filter_42_9]|uniref:Methionine aminopeptidase n=1 Tax=Candidatus Zambryskibacteria bacterium CG22_combo_CG10-13_8_21_14_all_42_17 TaxID=1975118 RepID=A0A2H0BDX1_9BACT|nr:MAG: type I methionyl aminopeptidase [Candidatus Zambryskibacteria bacterium CG22_combo_CG10-13_8_21_14_all_42_17]PJA36731.1 MAG: type I methionyl aminopeptidase [Candidatus Zambryskibacteria bacterium CG_4_9_14_3_um_filter_42_9]